MFGTKVRPKVKSISGVILVVRVISYNLKGPFTIVLLKRFNGYLLGVVYLCNAC